MGDAIKNAKATNIDVGSAQRYIGWVVATVAQLGAPTKSLHRSYALKKRKKKVSIIIEPPFEKIGVMLSANPGTTVPAVTATKPAIRK